MKHRGKQGRKYNPGVFILTLPEKLKESFFTLAQTVSSVLFKTMMLDIL